jgi:transposase InsO family protein
VYAALCGAAPRPNRLARPWRNGALGGLTKPALGDAENYEGWEKRTHIGRGSQYCSEYQAELKQRGIRISRSGKGSCYAMVETFFKTLKSELIWRTIFQTRTEPKLAIGRPE